MSFENKNIRNITPYKLASHKVWDEIDNKNILKLDWNEATIQSSPKVKERVLETIEKIGFRYYPDVNNVELVNSLARYTGMNGDQIQYFASSDAAQEYITSVFLNDNDKVLILGPTYDNFRLTCESRGSEVSFTKYDDDFKFNLESYLSEIERLQPKLAYICNPNNPTGTQISTDKIEYLLNKFSNVLFLVDEAYFEFSQITCANLVNKYNNLIVSRTFSKAFAIANFRIGYLIACPEIIESINKIRNAKNINSLSQEAAIAALSDLDYTQTYVDEVIESRKMFVDSLHAIFDDNFKIVSGNGNFVLIKCKSSEEKERIISGLLTDNIFVRDMSHVKSMDSYFRITIGTRSQMQRVLAKIKEICNEAQVCIS